MEEVVIISAVRTPIGSFMGGLSSVPAPRLGATAIKGALNKAGIDPSLVQEVFMGCVLQAGLGQAPGRQAALYAGIPNNVPCTTVNKVCASGMKAIALASQAIALGEIDVAVAGGMENMSSVPHYLRGSRIGKKLGDMTLADGMLLDGLVNVYDKEHMGKCAELCASEKHISREDQDAFAVESYKRASEAWKNGWFKDEVVPVEVPQRKGDPVVVDEDEEYKNIMLDKVPKLRSAFQNEGSVTAANSSTLNDGAAALVLMSRKKAEALNLTPLATIKSFADAAQAPEWFTTSPAKAVSKALNKAGMTTADVDYWELNEAFAVVGIVNTRALEIDPARVDVHGGAVALGHPLGCSGARIIVTLLHTLMQNDAKTGGAGICNGGGGASAMIIQRP